MLCICKVYKLKVGNFVSTYFQAYLLNGLVVPFPKYSDLACLFCFDLKSVWRDMGIASVFHFLRISFTMLSLLFCVYLFGKVDFLQVNSLVFFFLI